MYCMMCSHLCLSVVSCFCFYFLHRIGPDGADFPISTYVSLYEEETNELVEFIWTSSTLLEDEVATKAMLSRSPQDQLHFGFNMQRKKSSWKSGTGLSGLCFLNSINVTPQDLKAY